MFAIKAFSKDKTHIHVHLRVDNKTTMAQINKMGSTRYHRLFQITHGLWTYCLSRGIIITVEYLPGKLNEIADKESRVYLDRSNWMLEHGDKTNREHLGYTRSGPVCGQTHGPKTALRELEAGSQCSSDRCLQHNLDTIVNVWISPVWSDWSLFGQSKERPSQKNTICISYQC